MTTTEQELLSFTEFVRKHLRNGQADSGLNELFDLWRTLNSDDAAYRENVAAVQAAIDDVRNGDRGVPLEDHLRELREKYNIPDDE